MKRALKLIAALLLAASLLCTAALADMGPKPSVRISFEGLSGGAPCWGTLLNREGERWPGARARMPGFSSRALEVNSASGSVVHGTMQT